MLKGHLPRVIYHQVYEDTSTERGRNAWMVTERRLSADARGEECPIAEASNTGTTCCGCRTITFRLFGQLPEEIIQVIVRKGLGFRD